MSQYYTFDEIYESQDFNHDEKFIEYEYYETSCEHISLLEKQNDKLKSELELAKNLDKTMSERVEELKQQIVDSELVIRLVSKNKDTSRYNFMLTENYLKKYKGE